MIIRTLPLRHGTLIHASSQRIRSTNIILLGRHALPRSFSSARRFLSTPAPASSPEATLPPLSRDELPYSLPQRASLSPEDIRDPNHPVARQYLLTQHQRAMTDHLGAEVTTHYKPHELLSNPPRPQDITLELLLASQAHIGHATSLWHPGNAQYIHGIRGAETDPIHIISLDVTASHLRRACTVVRGVSERGGLVLFVGTRAGQARAVVRASQLAKGCHLFTKWTPGSISNGQQILGRCRKKVVDERDIEVLGFQDQLRRQRALKPDLVICLNPLENYVLLRECGLHNIPTIGIVDTDVNPTWVTYPIPANDDSLRCVQVIAGVLGRAGQEGQESRLQLAKEGHLTYELTHELRLPTREAAEAERAAKELELRARQQEYRDLGQIVLEELSEGHGDEGALAKVEEGVEEFDEEVGDEGLEAVDPSLLEEGFGTEVDGTTSGKSE